MVVVSHGLCLWLDDLALSSYCNSVARPLVIQKCSMLQALGVTLTEAYKRVMVEEPAKRKGGIMVSSVAELMDKLRNEAKVL